MPVPDFKLCHTAEEASEFAERVGYPVALRVVSRDVIHKSEVKGIALDLSDSAAVRRAWERVHRSVTSAMPAARIDGNPRLQRLLAFLALMLALALAFLPLAVRLRDPAVAACGAAWLALLLAGVRRLEHGHGERG